MSTRPSSSAYAVAIGGLRRRNLIVCASLGSVLTVAALAVMLLGTYQLSPVDLVAVFFGGGSPMDQFVVLRSRLPRLTIAVLAGVALGLAGAMLQSLLRNPLASPDLMGISGGASLAAVFATTTFSVTGFLLPVFAFFGALAVAAVLLASARRDSTASYRLVLTGVAISFLCAGLVGYLLKRAQVNQAQSALVWVVGSVGATRRSDVVVLAVAVAIAIPAVIAVSRTLPYAVLGDRTAEALGINANLARTGTLLTAVLLAASAVAFVGPVGFVALCAPAIARALIGYGSPALAGSAICGALIVVVSDAVAQHAIPGVSVPVGVITGVVGAPYLLWLLATSSKGARL